MKITAVTGSPDAAIGAGISTHRFLAHLAERGHQTSWQHDARTPFDADVVIISARAVEGLAIAARQSGAKVVALVHSSARSRVADAADLVVWNTTADRADSRGIVCHPPTNPDDYRTIPGDRITQVNLCEPKGGGLFWRLARTLTDVEFLGVRGGYGKQMAERRPNVDVVPTTQNMRDDVYARTRILLMPSERESWGMVGVEAMASGIPVIAHPTPGLRESLGDAGIFIDRNDGQAWVDEIHRLQDPDEWAQASDKALTRSGELDPQESLDRFAEAIESLVPRPSPRNPPGAAVVGTGRCGTGYMARLLGFGHEDWWNPTSRRTPNLDGDASWLALPDIEAGNHDGPVLHVTRHPVDVVRSLVGIGFFDGTDERDRSGLFRGFAVEHLPAADVADPVEAAVVWWAEWNRRCAAVADLTVKIEDVHAGDAPTLSAIGELLDVDMTHPLEVSERTNGRRRSRTTAKRIWSLLDGRADRFDYFPDE